MTVRHTPAPRSPGRRSLPGVLLTATCAVGLSAVALVGAGPAMAAATAPDVTASADAAPDLSADSPDADPIIGNSIAGEGDSGLTSMGYSVYTGEPVFYTRFINWETADVTAVAGTDYVAASGTVVILPGLFSGFLSVDAMGDTDVETDETYSVLYEEDISRGVPRIGGEARIAGTATGTILNDDSGPATADLSVTASSSPDPVVVGQDLTYNITITNQSVATASAVQLVTAIDSQLVPVSILPSPGGTCTYDTDVDCSFGDLIGGDLAFVSIVARTTRTTGELPIATTVSSSTPDDDASDNAYFGATSVVEDEWGCTIVGSNASETLIGTPSDDVICGRGGDDLITGGNGNDELRGGAGDDTLDGEMGDDLHLGWVGEDIFMSGAGNDGFDGGGGWDTAVYAADSTPVSIDLRGPGTSTDGYGATDTLSSIGTVVGTGFADLLNGSNRPDKLDGNAGDDVLFGRGGNDSLVGSDGIDAVTGNSGADICDAETMTSCES